MLKLSVLNYAMGNRSMHLTRLRGGNGINVKGNDRAILGAPGVVALVPQPVLPALTASATSST